MHSSRSPVTDPYRGNQGMSRPTFIPDQGVALGTIRVARQTRGFLMQRKPLSCSDSLGVIACRWRAIGFCVLSVPTIFFKHPTGRSGYLPHS